MAGASGNRPLDLVCIEYINKRKVDTCYNEYEPTKAGRLISDFVNDNLSNWYVRLNRKRFWGGEFTQDKLSAYQTLYTCLETVAKLMAPISPFYADRLYTGFDYSNRTRQCSFCPSCLNSRNIRKK